MGKGNCQERPLPLATGQGGQGSVGEATHVEQCHCFFTWVKVTQGLGSTQTRRITKECGTTRVGGCHLFQCSQTAQAGLADDVADLTRVRRGCGPCAGRGNDAF